MFLERNLEILSERLPVLDEIDIKEEQEKAINIIHAMTIGFGIEHWTFSDQSKMLDINRDLFTDIFSSTDLTKITYNSRDKRSTVRNTLIDVSDMLLESYNSYLIWGGYHHIEEFATRHDLTENDINRIAEHQGVTLAELDFILEVENVFVSDNLYDTVARYFNIKELLMELLDRKIDTEENTLIECILEHYDNICILAPDKIVEFVDL